MFSQLLKRNLSMINFIFLSSETKKVNLPVFIETFC